MPNVVVEESEESPHNQINHEVIKRFCKDFQTNNNVFIKEKERLNSKNAKVGGRSIHEATGHAYFSAKAPFRAIGAKLKNPDHANAQRQRDTMLAYAHYLNWLAYEIGQADENTSAKKLSTFWQELHTIEYYLEKNGYKSNKFIGDRNHPNSVLYGAEQRLQQLGKKIPLSQPKDKDPTKGKFILLWPQLLNLENMSECFLSNVNYTASDVYEWAKSNVADYEQKFTSIAGLQEIFNAYTQDQKSKVLIINPQPNLQEEVDKEIEKNQVAELVQLSNLGDVKKPKKIGLKKFVEFADNVMEMDSDPDKYKDYRIIGFNDDNQPLTASNSHFNENEPLADGWYQYVIVANENGNYNDDFRYYPCAKIKPADMERKMHAPYQKYIAHSQIAGGLDIYAGGAFRVQNGVIDKIDNSSGHYPTEQLNMCYAGKRLMDLGMRGDSTLIIKTAPALTGELKKQRNKTKADAAAYAFFSVGGNDKAQRSEDRPILPLSVQQKAEEFYDRTSRLQVYLEQTAKELNPVTAKQSRSDLSPIL